MNDKLFLFKKTAIGACGPIALKIEAFDNSHFMHKTLRGCHTDSIVSLMSKIIFNVTGNSLKIVWDISLVR